jgi:myo-inositol 2-dehydrogenase / D-chiro-inositol 1-dehydrogenase
MKRREFLTKSGATALGTVLAPTIVPSTVLGKNAPNSRITVGMIGTGRQAVHVNLKNGFLQLPNCQVMAVNDVDSWRMDLAAATINEAYSKPDKKFNGVKKYNDYRELIANKSIDAVMVTTPDHWHIPAGIAAALAGKHVAVEKALSISYSHSKALIEAVKTMGVANRLDSEFRSLRAFQRAVEIVHNQIIGELKHVIVGVPGELNGSAVGPQPGMAIPKELNYDMWLGPAFPAPYTQKRVHDPGTIDTRPGWLRIDDYCNGMITNWGAHLVDIALWGMKREYELPVKVKGTGSFSKGLWNTIEVFEIEYTYADGFVMHYKIDQPYVLFEGSSGWVKVTYADKLEASDQRILDFKPSAGEKDYAATLTDKADFIKAVETGGKSFEPLEVGHNVYFTTLMGLMAVKLGCELTWDKAAGSFVDDTAANAMLIRPFREKWLDRNVVEWMKKYQEIKLG